MAASTAPLICFGRVPGEEVRVEGDLIVPAPARVQLERHVAHDLPQPALDRRVHVLVGEVPGKPPGLDLFEYRFEPSCQLGRLFLRNDPPRPEHPGVGYGAPDVVGGQTDVEGNGRVEALEGLGRRGTEPSTPQRTVVSPAHERAV